MTAIETVAPQRGRVRVVFGGILLAMLLGSLDQTIVATALPTIVGDLGGLGHLSWVVTAYVLAATAATPLWGRLSDLYGRKRFFQAAIVIFLIGSALCGLARTMPELIAFRALQGIGGGGLMTLAMALVGDIVEPRERGRYQGYIQAVFIVASIAGPLLGGFFVDHLSWRWVFYVNLPVGGLTLAVIAASLRPPARRGRASVDYAGAALLTGAIVALLLVTSWGGQVYAWTSAPIVGLAVGCLALTAAFVARERRAAEPILPLRMFRDPLFAVVTATVFVTTMVLFAVLVFMPPYLQVVTGSSATDSGLLLLPMLLSGTLTTIAAGRFISATGRYRFFPATGLAIMTAGLYLLSRGSTSHTAVTAFMIVFGLGFGMVSQVLLLAVQNSVDRRDLGTATAAVNTFRALGGAVGTPVFGAVLNATLHGITTDALKESPQRLRAVPGAVDAVAHSLHSVFLVATPVAAAGFLVALLLRPARR